MALPLVPVIVGAAIGAGLMYLLKDKVAGPTQVADKAKEAVKKTADAAVDAAESVAESAEKVAGDVKKSVG